MFIHLLLFIYPCFLGQLSDFVSYVKASDGVVSDCALVLPVSHVRFTSHFISLLQSSWKTLHLDNQSGEFEFPAAERSTKNNKKKHENQYELLNTKLEHDPVFKLFKRLKVTFLFIKSYGIQTPK